MSKARGSAILIAIFLLAAIGSVAFGIGRLFLMETNLAGLYENSTIAYYAAESGIEDGMLRYRYDKNQQLPLDAGNFDATRINVNNLDWTPSSTAMWNPATSFQPTDPTKHVYGMQMSYLKDTHPYYGLDADKNSVLDFNDLNHADYAKAKEFAIGRDNSIKIDVTKLAMPGGDDLWLYVKPMSMSSTCAANYSMTGAASRPFLEAKVTGVFGSETIEQKIGLVYRTSASPVDPKNPTQIASENTAGVLKYTNLLTTIRNSTTSPIFVSGKVELSLKPIGCDILFGIRPADLSNEMAQPYTTVKSTGYYGGVTRTVEAKIDRQAGTLYDLFDFVLYDRR